MKRIFLSATLFFSLGLYSQETEDSVLVPVEVRAVRASSTAPFAKTNISKNEIQKQNLGQDLPFLLNQAPSVVINSDAGNGVGYTGMRIRGTDATRINVTLNGIPYNDAESQGVFFVNLPDFASSLHSIQVQRGVGTSTNGAGAFGASLHLSTNEIIKNAYAEVNNSYGSFNTLKNTIKAGTGLIGEHFTADIRLSRISSDGYIDRASTNLRSLYFSTAYLSEKTDLRLNILTGKEKTYQAWNGVSADDLLNNRTINYAGMERPGTPYENETDNYRQDHYQFFFTRKFTPQFSFNTAIFLTRGLGYYEQYKAGEDFTDYGMLAHIDGNDTFNTTDLVRQLWLDNYYYGAIFSLQKQSANQNFIFGGAYTQYKGDHIGKVIWTQVSNQYPHTWYIHPAYKRDANIYGKWQQSLGSYWQLFGDLQYRNVQYELEGFRDNPTLAIQKNFGFLNPKLGISFIKNRMNAYVSFSMAGKEPNRDDFEAGNFQQPKPERLYDWEAGLEKRSTSSFWSANIYYMKYRDQLVLTGRINDVGAYTRINIPKSYRLGVELQAGLQLTKWMKANANINLSRNKILDFTEFIDDYDMGGQKEFFYKETDISFSPSVVAAATINIKPIRSIELDLLSKYVGKQFLDNTSTDNRKLDAYFVQDLRFTFSPSISRLKKLSLVLQVNNVFNNLYEPNGYTFSYYYNNYLTTENYYFPMAGINWMAGLNIRF